MSITTENEFTVDRRQEGRLASRAAYRPYVVASVGIGAPAREAPPPLPEHRPRRPLWICHADGSAWPCGTARTQLITAYRTDQEALTRQMLWLMAAAATDLGVLRPAKLYRRFVAWTLPSGARCRACGTRRHDLLPGIPPRLFPCPDFP